MNKEIRLAVLGMIEGSGHPDSWWAIINGYDPVEMAKCPYATIPEYHGAQPLETVRIPHARVTHIWTSDPAATPREVATSRIEHIVARSQGVVGQVDAAVMATDDGNDHVRRVRPFVEASLPVFVDKPLVVHVPDLRQFLRWHRDAAR